MKKTYIKPENTVVALNVCDNVLVSISGDGNNLIGAGGDSQSASITESDAREIIKTPDAWEEW
ncbi:MAG: hypothetical protein IKG75_08900 [Bacteroidaceae bacterium]|nr:hypothetical protein [Bacteroidaceae bacterium]